MSECCSPDYSSAFTPRGAARDARRYRRRGLLWGPRRTVELYRQGVLAGTTLLEVGGGVGDLQIETWRFHVHPPQQLRAAVEAAGLRVVHEERNLVDHLTVFAR